MTLGAWSSATAPNSNNWRGITYSPSLGLFCVTSDGSGPTGRAMTSPDGINWTAHTISADAFADIIWVEGLGLFITVGNPQANTAVSTSPDGVNWTVRSATSGNASSVAWSPALGYMIAPIRGDAAHVYKSTNGTTWSAVASTGGNSLTQRIIWDDVHNNFIAITDSGVATTSAYTSPDGVTWTARTIPSALTLFGITINPSGVCVAVALSGTNRTIRSDDGGVTWTAHAASNEQPEWEAVCWDDTDGVFIAVAAVGTTSSGIIMTSPDGITWTSKTAPANVNFRGVVYGAGVAVAVANTGTAAQRVAISESITGGSIGSVNAQATVTGHAIAQKAAQGSASGAAAVTGHSGSTKLAAGAASGHATVVGISNIVHTGAGSASGHATVHGVSAATKDSVGSASGTATVNGVGIGTRSVEAVGAAAGVATVVGRSNNDLLSVGTASGRATVLGVSASLTFVKGLGQLLFMGAGLAAYTAFIRATGLTLVAGDQKRVANAIGTPMVKLKAQQAKIALKANIQE
jgi:hypothetical protein